MKQLRPSWRGDSALVVCAIGWGATFPVVEAAMRAASPVAFNAARFLLAAAALSWILVAPGVAAVRRAGGWGLGLGALLAVGFSLQAWAIPQLGPTRSAFLTAFYVIFTPLLDWLVIGRRPQRSTALGALLAFGGAAAMSGVGRGGAISPADLATLTAALLFAGQLVGLHEALARHSSRALLFSQVLATGLLCLLAAPLVETVRFETSPGLLARLFFLALVATALFLGLQNYGQAHTTPTRAAILFASEPVWAALFGRLSGEVLAPHQLFGAAIVLTGIVVATVPPRAERG
ncbi:MAG: DMT family transporter [Acidobacteria bacterium]|jgi:drug/metabolite transporter (DMT)-like permease|nr:DMT family transporter [Acidobacteriota bacterium]MCU0253328.1 DMT family transporter [Acidobacteriota bacterium]